MSIEDSARATLADLAERRRHVTATIIQLATFYGLDATEYLSDATTSLVRETKPAARATKRGKRERPTRASSEVQDAILAALKEHGPMSPKQVAKCLGKTTEGIKYQLMRLIRSGRVVGRGATAQRILSLPE